MRHDLPLDARFQMAISDLWSVSDFPESRQLDFLDDTALAEFLGEWPDIRKACDENFEQAHRERPEVKPKHPFNR